MKLWTKLLSRLVPQKAAAEPTQPAADEPAAMTPPASPYPSPYSAEAAPETAKPQAEASETRISDTQARPEEAQAASAPSAAKQDSGKPKPSASPKGAKPQAQSGAAQQQQKPRGKPAPAKAPPPLSEARYANQARQSARKGNPQAALAIAEQGLADHPRSASLWAVKGEACLRLNQSQEAETAFRLALERDPKSAAALSGCAQAAEKAQAWEQALTRWQACLDTLPEHPNVADWELALANTLLKLEHHQEAEALYAKLAERQPPLAACYAGLARIASARQDWPTAADRWQDCLKRFPKHKQAGEWQALWVLALTQSGRYAEAEKHYQAQIGENRNAVGPYEGLAGLAEAQNQPGIAVERYRDCLAVNPKHPKARAWRIKIGNLLLGLGMLDAAECEFQALADQYPSLAAAKVGLQRVAKLRKSAVRPAGSGQ